MDTLLQSITMRGVIPTLPMYNRGTLIRHIRVRLNISALRMENFSTIFLAMHTAFKKQVV